MAKRGSAFQPASPGAASFHTRSRWRGFPPQGACRGSFHQGQEGMTQWDLLFRALAAPAPCPHTPHNHRSDLNPSLPTNSALPGTKLVPRADGGGRSAVPWGKWGLSLGTPTRCLLPAAPVPACPAQSHVRRGALGACHPPLGTSGAAAGPGWEPGAP